MRAMIWAILAAFSLTLPAMGQDAVPPAVMVDEATPAAEQAPAPSEKFGKQLAKRSKKKKIKAAAKAKKKKAKAKGKQAKKKAKRKARAKYSEF